MLESNLYLTKPFFFLVHFVLENVPHQELKCKDTGKHWAFRTCILAAPCLRSVNLSNGRSGQSHRCLTSWCNHERLNSPTIFQAASQSACAKISRFALMWCLYVFICVVNHFNAKTRSYSTAAVPCRSQRKAFKVFIKELSSVFFNVSFDYKYSIFGDRVVKF